MGDAHVYDPPMRMTGWTIHATCPGCGGTLAHAADGRPGGVVSRAMARCISCDSRWKAEITLTYMGGGR